jgi:hypothetical protein
VLASASPDLRRWAVSRGGGVMVTILTSEGSLVRSRDGHQRCVAWVPNVSGLARECSRRGLQAGGGGVAAAGGGWCSRCWGSDRCQMIRNTSC